MTDKQIIEPCMGCSSLECWGVVDCDVAQRVLALHKTLTEIKEIAENGKRFAERWMITGEQKTNVLTYANAILQKISECEGNDGN
jgi:hypothetical protein